MQAAIFIHEGLGNTLLLVPLIKKLQENGRKVSGIFTSRFQAHELFKDIPVFENKIVISNNADYIKIGTQYVQKFDEAYLDWFSATRKNIVLANSVAKKIITNRMPDKLPRILKKRVTYVEPLKKLHESTQNLRLFDPEIATDNLKGYDFALKLNKRQLKIMEQLPEKYAAVQFAGGNNKTPYKHWPVKNWQEFFAKSEQLFPNLNFVLLGDKNEIETAENIEAKKLKNVISVAGKTSINDAVHILHKSLFYIGSDSGFMHLAVNFNKPTFSIWGGSDYNMYGYKKLDEKKHHLVYKKLPCHPCNSYLAPNTSRVSDPLKCPDFKCIKNISHQEALDAFKTFLNNNQSEL